MESLRAENQFYTGYRFNRLIYMLFPLSVSEFFTGFIFIRYYLFF